MPARRYASAAQETQHREPFVAISRCRVGTVDSRRTGAGPHVDPHESACGPLKNAWLRIPESIAIFSVEFGLSRDARSLATGVLWSVAGYLADWPMRERSARDFRDPFSSR